MAGNDLPKPDYATGNMRLVGYCDQGGRSDGVQIMVHRGYAYIGHIFSKGFTRRRCPRSEKAPKVGEICRRSAEHLDASPSSLRRSAARHPQQGHVRAA